MENARKICLFKHGDSGQPVSCPWPRKKAKGVEEGCKNPLRPYPRLEQPHPLIIDNRNLGEKAAIRLVREREVTARIFVRDNKFRNKPQ